MRTEKTSSDPSSNLEGIMNIWNFLYTELFDRSFSFYLLMLWVNQFINDTFTFIFNLLICRFSIWSWRIPIPNVLTTHILSNKCNFQCIDHIADLYSTVNHSPNLNILNSNLTNLIQKQNPWYILSEKSVYLVAFRHYCISFSKYLFIIFANSCCLVISNNKF